MSQMTSGPRRVLLVTGGSRGIGAATVRLAAARGYDVCVNYRSDAAAAAQVVEAATRAGARAVAVQADVAVEADVVRLFAECDDASGPALGPREQRRDPRKPDAARRHGRGAHRPRVRDQRHRRIPVRSRSGAADVHSLRRQRRRHRQRVVGRIADGIAGEYIDYAATKGALDTMTIGLSREVAPKASA